jgi:hypothetical protein
MIINAGAQWRRCGVDVRRVPVEYTQADGASELEAWRW